MLRAGGGYLRSKTLSFGSYALSCVVWASRRCHCCHRCKVGSGTWRTRVKKLERLYSFALCSCNLRPSCLPSTIDNSENPGLAFFSASSPPLSLAGPSHVLWTPRDAQSIRKQQLVMVLFAWLQAKATQLHSLNDLTCWMPTNATLSASFRNLWQLDLRMIWPNPYPAKILDRVRAQEPAALKTGISTMQMGVEWREDSTAGIKDLPRGSLSSKDRVVENSARGPLSSIALTNHQSRDNGDRKFCAYWHVNNCKGT